MWRHQVSSIELLGFCIDLGGSCIFSVFIDEAFFILSSIQLLMKASITYFTQYRVSYKSQSCGVVPGYY